MVENQSGFTLIEVLIVVAIIGVLASIAYPSYLSYVIKSHRVDAMAEMQNLATKIETKKLEKRAYTNINQSDIFTSTNFPYSGTADYTLSLSPVTAGNLTSSDWIITATPVSTARMKNDGILTINAQGIKCRGTVCGKANEWN